jgi:sterol desaturase/sphingolipid hydroxylase (fatty acid hydroxylase superfamily)
MATWAVISFGAIVLMTIVAENLYPRNTCALTTTRRSYAVNVVSYLLNNVVLSVLSLSSLYALAERFNGHGLLATMPDGALKWAMSFLLFDLLIYVWHWACHNSLFLWMFHKVHHSDMSVNASTALRFHLGELALTVFVKALFIWVMGIPATTVVTMEIVTTLFVVIHHANVRIPCEAWLARFIVVPSLHRTHHSAARGEHDANYAIVFSVWDTVFGTRLETAPATVGLKGIPEHGLGLVAMIRLGLTGDRPASSRAVGGPLVPNRA